MSQHMQGDSELPLGTDYFGRGHWLSRTQARYSLAARRQMFELWHASCQVNQGESLVDIGSTPDTERIDSNCMLPWFHEIGLKISLYSIEDISHLVQFFSYAKIESIQSLDGISLPFADRSRDWVSASAVIEHVGGRQRQIFFIQECGRVARKGIFLTAPNRGHWLEFHTKLPFIHWLPKTAHRRILRGLGKDFWAQEENLNLVHGEDLRQMAVEALPSFDVQLKNVRSLGAVSNLVLIATRRP